MALIPKLNQASFEASIHAIDTHTVGEFTRIVTDGFPAIKANSIMEKKQILEKEYDKYRRALMNEPRGHKDMFGALLSEPCNQEADLGVVFMDTGGYLNMCGHGTIGSATVAVEAGLVPVKEPYTEVVLEAPAGIIRTQVKVENGKAKEVTLTNVPAFLYKSEQVIDIDGHAITYDISFGGSFFALVDTTQPAIQEEIDAKNIPFLTTLGMKLLKAINQQVQVKHPYLPIDTVDLVEFYGPTSTKGCSMRNVVIFGDAQADRSPCGTGTSAKLAALYARGKIGIGEPFVYESFIGSRFTGVIKEETTVDGYKAIVPMITGSAYITGEADYLIDPDDPLKYGFIAGV